MEVISIDYETYFDKECSVKTLGNWAYTHHPKFDAYLVAVYDGHESWVGHPKDLCWEALEGATLVAHNAGFERSVCNVLAEQGKAPVLKNTWYCTANMTAYLCSERSLAAALWVLEGKRVSKAIRDEMSGVHWEDLTPDEQRAMSVYADGDARECRDLFIKYGDRWPQFERDLSELTIKQSLRGGAIDLKKLEEYHKAAQFATWTMRRSLPWVVEQDAKPGSPPAIAAECRKVGIPCPPLKKDDEAGFDLWEATYSPRFPWVAGVGKHRKLNKLVTFLETIQERLRPDGTIDWSLLYFGAHTGRWSGGGAGLNMQNLRKDPYFFKDGLWIETPDAEKEANLKIDVRSLFVPRPGKKFIICDLSQIEPRVLAWLVNDEKFLKFVAAGQSPYEAHARATMGWTGGDLKKENNPRYKLAKARVLGLGYGCGEDKFIVVAQTLAGLVVTPEESHNTVQQFRADNPKITALWGQLDSDFQRSVRGSYNVELPSGRNLEYRKVQRETRLKKDKKTGEMKPRFVYTALIGQKRYELYGGLLTENLVQATAREVFGCHLLDLEANVGDVLFHVHDEAAVEVDLDVTVAEVEARMSRTPDWLAGCPISAEGQEAAHYLK